MGMIQTTVFSRSLSNFACKVVNDERRNPIDFWSRGQRSRSTWPPARGCHALRCLVLSEIGSKIKYFCVKSFIIHI